MPGSLIFRDEVDCDTMRSMSRAWKNRPSWTQQSIHSPAIPIGNGQLRSVHMAAKMQAPPIVGLPFFKIKNRARRHKVMLEDRNLAAVAAFNRLMSGAEQGEPHD